MNKKAQLEVPGTLVDVYSYIAFVLIIMLFFLLFQLKSCTSESRDIIAIESQVSDLDYNMMLLNYLRTPVIVDGSSMTMADLIALWYSDKTKYEQLLTDKSKETINKWTYERKNPYADNQVIMAFNILIYSKKHIKGEVPDIILRIPSADYKYDYCIGLPCQDLAGIYVPVSQSNKVYVALWASMAAKSLYE